MIKFEPGNLLLKNETNGKTGNAIDENILWDITENNPRGIARKIAST